MFVNPSEVLFFFVVLLLYTETVHVGELVRAFVNVAEHLKPSLAVVPKFWLHISFHKLQNC